ncbi:MAG: hypothetical protein HY334_02055, partial [Armatimonadetes bacterium]|nr:hypothetical protein [Armatimonadota bacterium]
QFEGQTKAKLGNLEVKSHVETAVADGLAVCPPVPREVAVLRADGAQRRPRPGHLRERRRQRDQRAAGRAPHGGPVRLVEVGWEGRRIPSACPDHGSALLAPPSSGSSPDAGSPSIDLAIAIALFAAGTPA